jgi:hypothetical protein
MLGLSFDAQDRAKIADVIAGITGKQEMAATAFATAAINWLGHQHAYSLRPVIPAGAGDPLVRWLTSREGGHCELFAGSMVVLARSAGIPARVVTGFRGGSWNGYSNNFTLRNSDAHAWCEIFDVGTQTWTRVDPTPGVAGAEASGARGEGALARRSDRSWKAMLESLRDFWYRQIVSFDQRSQIETFNAMKAATDVSSKRLRAALDRLGEAMREWRAQPWDGGKWTRVAQYLGLIVLGLLFSRGVLQRLKARRWQGRGGRKGDLVRMEAGKWLMRLKEIRADSASDQTKDDVMERLEEIRYGRSETWQNVAGTFARARKVWRARRKWARGPGRLA